MAEYLAMVFSNPGLARSYLNEKFENWIPEGLTDD